MTTREMRLVLTMDDFEAAVTFFRDGLGMPEVAAFQNGGGHGILLEAGRATLEIFDVAQAAAIDTIEVGRRVAGKVRVAFEVPDSAATASKLATMGGEIIADAVLTPWGDRNARVRGPEDVQLTLFTPSTASS